MLCVYSGQGQTSGPQQIAVSQYAELLVQQLLDLIVARRSGTFEIDLRLRPFGSKGPLATSLDAFREYYRHGGQAAPFERQALIKLRGVAGDPALQQAVETLRDAFVYSAEPFALETAIQLRQRQRHELVAPGAIDAKYSQGGLVDIEYTVQYLQLRHGATVPALRTPHTLAALQALSQATLSAPQCTRRCMTPMYFYVISSMPCVWPAGRRTISCSRGRYERIYLFGTAYGLLGGAGHPGPIGAHDCPPYAAGSTAV